MSSLYPLSTVVLPAQEGSNNIWIWVIVFIVVVLVVWWLLSRATKQPPAVKPPEETPVEKIESKKAQVVAPPAPAEPKPPVPPAPAPPKEDDLAVLEGIGPKVNKLLNEAGIKNFAQLADTPVEKLKEILEANALQFLDPASWPEQAKLAAEGKSEELQALQDQLKGGRRAA